MKIINKSDARTVLIITLAVIAGVVIGAKLIGRGSGIRDLSSVKRSVDKLMILPKDEEPTLLIVEDKKQVKDQFLNAKSENGDEVLVYTKNKMVIIFRPSNNKIVAVGTVTVDEALVESKGASLTVLNGNNDQTKTSAIISQIKKAYPDMKVVDGGSANKQDFSTTIVIDKNNQKPNLKDTLATLIDGKVGVVPLSESQPSSDLLLIVGKD